MTNADILVMLKANIQQRSSAFDTYLTQLIAVAQEEIERDYKINLDGNSVSDANLVVMYASWLYAKRNSQDSGKPRMLVNALHNRWAKEACADDNA